MQCLHVIDEIDFLHEFLITNDATELSVIFVDLRVHGEATTVLQSENESIESIASLVTSRMLNAKSNVHFTTIGALPLLLFVFLLIVVGSAVRLEFVQIEKFPLAIRARFSRFQVVQCRVLLE